MTDLPQTPKQRIAARCAPFAPASTISSMPRSGTVSRATGWVSAQGQGRGSLPPARLSPQERSSSACARAALAWM